MEDLNVERDVSYMLRCEYYHMITDSQGPLVRISREQYNSNLAFLKLGNFPEKEIKLYFLVLA
jgi:hypothetical protein